MGLPHITTSSLCTANCTNKAALAADQSGLLWQRKRWGNEVVRHGFGHHINDASFKLAVPSDTCSQRILQLFADTAKQPVAGREFPIGRW